MFGGKTQIAICAVVVVAAMVILPIAGYWNLYMTLALAAYIAALIAVGAATRGTEGLVPALVACFGTLIVVAIIITATAGYAGRDVGAVLVTFLSAALILGAVAYSTGRVGNLLVAICTVTIVATVALMGVAAHADDSASTLLTSILVTMIIMGAAAYMTGAALANTWRSVLQVLPYGVLIGFADRFFVWGLFGGELGSASGYAIDTLYLMAVCLLAFRLNQARKMGTQYPWINERLGPFSWRERSSGDSSVP